MSEAADELERMAEELERAAAAVEGAIAVERGGTADREVLATLHGERSGFAASAVKLMEHATKLRRCAAAVTFATQEKPFDVRAGQWWAMRPQVDGTRWVPCRVDTTSSMDGHELVCGRTLGGTRWTTPRSKLLGDKRWMYLGLDLKPAQNE